MFIKGFLSLFAFASLLSVRAQSQTSAGPPVSTGSIPICVLTCTSTAASQSGCNGVADLPCVCTSQKFQAAALSCLKSSCSAADQTAANSLQSALCASVSSSSGSGSASSGAASGTPTAPSSTLSTPTSGASSPASSAANSPSTSSNAASGLKAIGFSTGNIIGAVGVVVGMMAGAGALL